MLQAELISEHAGSTSTSNSATVGLRRGISFINNVRETCPVYLWFRIAWGFGYIMTLLLNYENTQIIVSEIGDNGALFC